ncbi:MAG TPA: NAD(P)/FAD-dependent oxidoreductase [Chthoniobacteraceae bacterium]|jgi:geranylgeranyl reductase family protein
MKENAEFDLIVVGAGPAGSTCAAFSAAAGMKVLLLEKAKFPREKVCGDCINPACWPVLERLGVAGGVRALPHSQLTEVEFIGTHGAPLRFPLHASSQGEIAVKRSAFDQLLMERAAALGATVQDATAVTSIEQGWRVQTTGGVFAAPLLVAADGRNSTVARLLELLPPAHKDRIGLQTHVPAPDGFGERVSMRFLPHGYCGVASVGGAQLNLCLVARPQFIDELKQWAGARFEIAPNQQWQTIAPLARAPVPPSQERLLLVGDAARVVEPFTGEGIYYALASGELAARHLVAGTLPSYQRDHRQLYRGRLWINELSRMAAEHPRLATLALDVARFEPRLLRFLTSKVIGPALPS